MSAARSPILTPLDTAPPACTWGDDCAAASEQHVPGCKREPVTAADFDLEPVPAPVKRPHWLVDAVRTAPPLLLWLSGFGVGLALVGADRVGALVVEHVLFRAYGL